MDTHTKSQETAFYQELQNCEGLDFRNVSVLKVLKVLRESPSTIYSSPSERH